MRSGAQTGFINIDSATQLGSNDLQYEHTVWFCQQQESQPRNYERTRASLSGEFKQTGVSLFGSSEFRNEVTAQLEESGSGYSFSADTPRCAETSGEFGVGKFKAAVTMPPSNILTSKIKELFAGSR